MAKWMPASSRPGTRQVARRLRPARQHHRVVIGQQLVDRDVDADLDAGAERDAFGLHLRDAAVDQVLFHLEVGNAVAQQAADAVVLLEQGHRMAGAGQLLGAGQARRARAHHRHASCRSSAAGGMRLDPAFFPAAIDDLAFDGFDGDRVVVDVQGAGGLARRRADAAGEFREIVGGVQVDRRHAPLVAIDQIVPVGDLVVDRAALVAERECRNPCSAPPAGSPPPAAADGRIPCRSSDARLRLFIAAVLPLDLQKAGDFPIVNFSSRSLRICRRSGRLFGRHGARRPQLGQGARVVFGITLTKCASALSQSSSSISRARAAGIAEDGARPGCAAARRRSAADRPCRCIER